MTEIFMKLTELPRAPKPLKNLPGCWEFELPGGWLVAVNGHGGPMLALKTCGEALIPAFHAAFVHRELMIMAVVSPFGGATIGGDTEDQIIAALDAEIARAS